MCLNSEIEFMFSFGKKLVWRMEENIEKFASMHFNVLRISFSRFYDHSSSNDNIKSQNIFANDNVVKSESNGCFEFKLLKPFEVIHKNLALFQHQQRLSCSMIKSTSFYLHKWYVGNKALPTKIL